MEKKNNFIVNRLVIFNHRWKRKMIVFLLIFLGSLCSLFIYSSFIPTNSHNRPAEIRGVWLTNVDSEVLFESKTLTKSINVLSKLNFNTLYPAVWNWGYTLYPSDIAQSATGQKLDPEKRLQKRDVLREIVEQGHKKGLAVIPWFEFGFMAPANSELAQRNKQWLTQRQDKSTIWLEGKTHERVWLNPLHPEVQNFITSLLTEIVTNYNIDGIQLDDHFGIPYDFGYDDFTIELYKKEHDGKSPPQTPSYLKMGINNCMSNDPAWIEWTRWRSEKITQYIKTIFITVKKINPNIIMSVSPNPQTFSANCFLLDWQDWEEKGLIEELVLQVYREKITDFRREINRPEVKKAKSHIPFGIGILSGLKNRPIPMKRIVEQVKNTRNSNLSGVSFFFYESLWNMGPETLIKRQSIFKEIFPTLTNRPLINN